MERQNLDILPGGVLPVIHCSQGDIGREFQINLFSDNAPYVLDGTEELTIDGHKEDNNIFSYSIPATTGSTITISTQEQMTACAGNTICEIRIFKNDIRIGTCNFILQVEEGVSNGTPSESTLQAIDEIRAVVEQAVEDAQTAQHNAETAETNAETAETNAINAKNQSESARDLSQTYATNSSNSATDSKNWAVGPSGSGSGTDTNNAKYYSQLASQSEQNASTSETNASNSASAAHTSETNASNSASAAHTSEVNASQSESNANDSAVLASNKATEAEQSANKVTNMTVSATQLAEGSSPTVTKTVGNVVNLEFGIPKGDTGDTGATPNINVTASVDGQTGNPSVSVTKTGTAENPSFELAFSGLKGSGSVVTFSPTKTSGDEIGQLTINGTTYYLYCSGGTNVSYTPSVINGTLLGTLTIDNTNYEIRSPQISYQSEYSSDNGTKIGRVITGTNSWDYYDIYVPKEKEEKYILNVSNIVVPTFSKNFETIDLFTTDNGDIYLYSDTDTTNIYKLEFIDDGNGVLEPAFSRETRATYSAENIISGRDIWMHPKDTYHTRIYNNSYSMSWGSWSNFYGYSGISNFKGRHVWTDGVNTYYSNGSEQYLLEYVPGGGNATATTFSGLSSFYGNNVWTDGTDIYYDHYVITTSTTYCYKLDTFTKTWNVNHWVQDDGTALVIDGRNVFTDGTNTYVVTQYGSGHKLYQLTNTYNTSGYRIWKNIYTSGSIPAEGQNVFLGTDGNYYISTTTKTKSGSSNRIFLKLNTKQFSNTKVKPM